MDRSKLKKAIVDTYLPFDPERIILFGSLASGQADRESDVDLIVVYRTEKRFLDRLKDLYEAWCLPKGVDILAYTPEEFAEMLESNSFVQDALDSGEVLYEKR
jgi:predicted nucleotidyltransferase